MELRTSSFDYPASSGEPQSASQTVAFPRDVQRVAVGITGYSAGFQDSDHHVGRVTAEVSARIDPDDAAQVLVTGAFQVRDWSGDLDDTFLGNVQWALLADLVAATPPAPGAPRGDLLIVDAEVTQVVQHFRSHQHLSEPNVAPDNSISLIADKPTVVRLYVDYDRFSGLPTINLLSGTLAVASPGGSTVLAPLESIPPRRDVAIDRGNRRHTLNFVVPEGLCRGTVTLRGQVFDSAAPDQFSADFEREVRFQENPELPIMAVGINYTGPDVNDDATPADLVAPTEADFVDLFDLTRQVYPVPDVVLTSFTTMDYDEEITSDIEEGCDRFADLKDAVGELRGDSDDIVYGLLNSGVDNGSVGGCGGSGVAVGIIGRQGTAAHEVGHALGRRHAPCDNVTRCASPRNTDDDYPVFSGFASDSIGEYGFDPRIGTGRVLDPATAHDFMGYSGNRWVSAYTYTALMSRIPERFGAAAAGRARRAERDGEWVRRKTPHLFLRLDIARDRSVALQPAFSFPALPRPLDSLPTDFSVALLGEDGSVLRSACLYADAGCCDCAHARWPVRIRQAVAFSPAATTLVVYEGDRAIHTVAIGEPPAVEVSCDAADDPAADALTLRWSPGEGEGYGADDLWSLVQWRDRGGEWRGVAPRTRARELRVPKRIFGRQSEVVLRVLVTAGIATGSGEWRGPLRHDAPDRDPSRPGVVKLVGVPEGRTAQVPPVLTAAALLPRGGTAASADIRWYAGDGGEVGRGRSLDLRRLPAGQSRITAVAFDQGEGAARGEWLVSRDRAGAFAVLRGTITDDDSGRRG